MPASAGMTMEKFGAAVSESGNPLLVPGCCVRYMFLHFRPLPATSGHGKPGPRARNGRRAGKKK